MTVSIDNALILNVDDTEAARYAKTRILMRAGFRVIEAGSGTEALARARADRPDLVLLDIKLPDINGFEVCRQLKADIHTQPILVLQTSASYIASADKIRALEGGADNYLFEPIEPEELVANVKALLRLGRVERELREADRRKDVFLATLAHELRNPLAPILTAAELMGMPGMESGEGRERARQTILRHTHYMIRLVDDLLDVSRITNGKIVLKDERVRLGTIIGAAAETAQAIVEQRGHALSVDMPAEDVMVRGDSVRLAQIVANLLTNAAKFTPPGGRIRLTAEREEGNICIRVADNGIGIAAGQADGIFDLFVQAGHAPDRPKEGLGIGLSLVKALVELHGGTVSVTSAGEGEGSMFEVCLPVAGDAADRRAGQRIAAGATGPARRVLVVDDNIDGAETMGALLEHAGHVVALSHTGADALAQADGFRPEIVVLDIGLPDMSGLEVARRLRSRADGSGFRLIALTGYGREDDKDNAFGAGFDLHLTKPVSLERLTAAIADESARHAD